MTVVIGDATTFAPQIGDMQVLLSPSTPRRGRFGALNMTHVSCDRIMLFVVVNAIEHAVTTYHGV